MDGWMDCKMSTDKELNVLNVEAQTASKKDRHKD